MSPRKHSCVATSIMANEIDLAVKSGRVRAASYEELYGSPRRTAPEPAGTDERSHRLRNILAIGSAVAFAMVLVGQRERIVKHAPAMATAYATIGLPVNVRGLTFRNVKATLINEGSQKILAVEGNVANIRNVALNVPDLRVAVDSADGREIYSWVAKSPKPNLTAGEEIYFRARLTAPPEQADKIVVRFAEAGSAPARPAR